MDKLHIDKSEFAMRMRYQFIQHSIEDFLHTSTILISISTREILVNCLPPSSILVRVCNEMDGDHFVLISPVMLSRLLG
jgi:hypothetical protein